MGLLSREEAIRLENIENKETRVPAEIDSFLNEIRMERDDFESSVNNWEKINSFRSGKISAIKSFYHKITSK